MSNDGLGDSTSHSEQPVTLTAEVKEEQEQEHTIEGSELKKNDTAQVENAVSPAPDQPVATASHATDDAASIDATQGTDSTATAAVNTTPARADDSTTSTTDTTSPQDAQEAAATSTAESNGVPDDKPASTDIAPSNTSNTASADAVQPASMPEGTDTPSIESEKAPSEAASLTPSTSNAGSSAAPPSSSVKTNAPPKKFTSSLSMNKKFLEKAGATDAKSPQPASASIPKPGTSPAARSPALASPGIPTHPGTSASPPITASSSAPRLLTGKLSSLASASGSGSTPPPSSSTTWGRPGLATGAPSGAAFGKSGFVPAGQVGNGGGGPPGSAGGPRLGGPPAIQQSLGRMRGAFGQQSRAGQAPWAAANRGAGGFSRGGSLDQEFPSFQEAARAEEQRQHALLAKERAEKMAAVAQAAYNQRVLDGLKSFSGEYTSNTTHWDELDDDDDDLGDVLEFADGTRYEVPQSATLPTEAEAAAFQQAAQAEKEAAALHAEYQESLAREQSKAAESNAAPSPVNKSERFIDDFDRGEQKKAAQEEQVPAPAASRQPASGRTLFNDRLGRFEPYAGRAPPPGKKDSKALPPSVLQRPARGAGPPAQDQSRPTQQRVPSGQQPPAAAKPAKSPLSPTTLTRNQLPGDALQAKRSETAPRKVESPWAKLPPVTQQPIPTDTPTPTTAQTQTTSTAPSIAAQPATTPTTSAPQTATPAAPAAAPATPAEDPEEAYKREMRSIAEQARKRRQDEEAEREAQKERARKKLQELEDKMKAAQKDATPAPTPTSAKPVPTSILSPPASKPDRQTNWRRPSIDIKPPQEVQKQIVSKQAEAQSSGRPAPSTGAQRQTAAERNTTPSSAVFGGLVNNATTARHQSDKPEAARTSGQTRTDATVQKHDAVQPSAQVEPAQGIRAQAGKPAISSTNDEATSPPTQAPRVRLGRRVSPRESLDDASHAQTMNTFGVPHAFPQPTILVGRNSRQQDGQAGSQPVSALDKIMSQVRAAQDDLKTRQAAAAMLEEEKRKMQGSSKEDFDGALDRISQALSQASVRGKTREHVPTPIKMNPTVVQERFDQTIPEPPQSPRIWKTFTVKIPSVMRSDVRDLPAWRVRAFEDPYYPPPIYSSSWIPPKGLRLPRNITLEDYLFGTEDTSAPPRVKVSKLYLTSAALSPEDAPAASTSSAVLPAHMISRAGLETSTATDKASLDSDAFIRAAPANLDEEEDIATIPFEEEEEDEELPAVIKVSLPKSMSPRTAGDERVAAQEAAAQEAGRFKTYGPKLPENSTVAFRRGISPSKAMGAPESSDRHIFMVNSELNGSREENLPSFMRSYDQQVVDEVSAPSRAFAAVSSASRPEHKPSPPLEPVFPSLSPGADRNLDSAETGSQSSFSGMRREELPRHVIAELERLNATVSATPLTNPPRLDSPASLLAGRSTSPWAIGSKATMMPSALSLSAIDPSMSVWSKPTEETAAAAAAAFNSASKDAANDSVQENSLKDLADDYPSSMPSNAMDLPISDGERPQSKDSESQRRSPSRSRRQDDRQPAMSISQVISSSSPVPPSMPLSGRSREHGSSRHGSFNFSPAQGYPGEGSPYGMSAQLPYVAGPANMHHQSVYSPGVAQAQYGGYVSAGTPTYATGYSSANGMPMMSPAYSTASPYSSVPITMTGQDGRSVSGHMSGHGSVWVPSGAMSGGMNGSFTSATAMSPYASSGVAPGGGQGYPGNSGGKTRMHSSPMYGSQQRPSPVGSSGGENQGYTSYGYPSAVQQNSPRHHYSTFSPQLPSPGQGGYASSPGVQGGYAGSQPNGSMNHLRSASAQQYGRRQGW